MTHNTTFLPRSDKIVLLQEGIISELGSYHKLLLQNGNFAELMKTYGEQYDVEKDVTSSDNEVLEGLFKFTLYYVVFKNQDAILIVIVSNSILMFFHGFQLKELT